MPPRVLAFLLACVLLWSGLSTYEPPDTAFDADAVLSVGGTLPQPGSVAHHHLDDQPAQSPSDLPADLPALLKAPRAAALAAAPFLPLPGPSADLRPAPWLAGLLRPPCGALFTA